MADKKISELGTAAAVYDADDFALVQDGDTKQVNASAVKAYIGDAPTIVGGTIDGATIGSDTASTGAFTTLSSSSTTTLNGTTIPASKTLLVTTDIGTTSGTVAAGDHTHTGVYEPADATILKDADIGSSVQAYDADLSAIAALSGTSGLLKKTAADTWTLDTSAYSTTVGTVTSVSGTGTVNGLTLTGTVTSSGSLTLGGALDLSSPPAIGGTTPAAGAFTTLSSTGNTTLGDASGDTLTINGTAVSAPNGLNVNSNQLVLSGGNLGLGVTPSANAGAKGLFIGSNSGSAAFASLSLGASGGDYGLIGYNVGFTGTAGSYKAISSDSMNWLHFSGGAFKFFQAGNVTAGTTQTGTQAMTLDASGNLLVGVTTANVIANDLAGCTIYGSGGPEFMAAKAGPTIEISRLSTTGGVQYFYYNSTNIAGNISINSASTVGYNQGSDSRLKSNIQDSAIASDHVMSMRVRSFDWISDGLHQDYGFIAQELKEVAPYAVYSPEDPKEMMGIDFSKLVPALVKAIQELTAEIELLKAKVN